jgi:hypothetical protein
MLSCIVGHPLPSQGPSECAQEQAGRGWILFW